MPKAELKTMAKNRKLSDAALLKRTGDKNFGLKAKLDEISDEGSDLIQINRAAKVITCIANGVNTLSEIGEYCGLGKSSVHRLLKALEKSHFIHYNEFNRRYLIGEMITDIAAKPETYHDYLYMCSGDEVEEVAEYTGETVVLLVLVGLRQFKVRAISSKYDLGVASGTRSSKPVFAGAGSQVLLSQLDDDQLTAAVKSVRWTKITGHSITSPSSILSRLKKIRSQGYSISSGERIPGCLCIAVPVLNYTLPTALILLGPLFRMKSKQSEYLTLMLKKAHQIELNLSAIQI
jgi:IclR family transcriptional regulator, KDG regulon repressor